MVSTLIGSASFSNSIRAIMIRAAELAVLPRYGKLREEEIREKSLDELVTIADRESEEILAEGLGKLLPEAAIVGEEAAEADPSIMRQLAGPLCWIIDPLDGTANFAAGDGPFGILIALAIDGLPVGGWIYDPRSGRFCSATVGHGAFIDGEPAEARSSGSAAPIAAISPLLESSARGEEIIQKLKPNFSMVRIPRCAAEQYPRIVLGTNDITLFERTLPWDHAAGVIFLTEAGGRATRFDGSAYRVDDDRSGLLAAANPKLWDAAMASITNGSNEA
jgi:fructose-1,6-bisphosphatase/inositol monophosphatase family enzyme